LTCIPYQPIIMTGKMNRVQAKAHIKFLAEADRIAPLTHALTRAPDNGKYPLTREQMKQCLIHGTIVEGPASDIKVTDGWKFTMHRFREGERNEVAGVLMPERKVIVITGYGWEKWKPAIMPVLKDLEEDDYGGDE
jgi:hypothetical protein